jgi:predicted CXXCH cytochrome family protein
MKATLTLAGLLVASLALVGKVHASAATGMNVIENSKHDFTLSYNGGAVGAAVNQCSTCHEMHKPVKMKPLWARNNPDANLNWITKSGALPAEYTNASFDAGTSTVTAGSQIPKWAFVDSRSGLCLSCHDGTQTVSDGGMITGRANLAVSPGDLSQNHRIGNERLQTSFRTSGGVTTWTVLSDAVLKAGDAVAITNVNGVVKTRYFVGCTTCHSMHSSPQENRKLLVNARDIGHGPVCWDCHGGK